MRNGALKTRRSDLFYLDREEEEKEPTKRPRTERETLRASQMYLVDSFHLLRLHLLFETILNLFVFGWFPLMMKQLGCIILSDMFI